MAFGKFLESSLCLLALVAGFFISVPLRLLEEQTGGTCLLFGEVDFLEKNITSGNIHYCTLGFYSSIVNMFVAVFLICLRWCCLLKIEKPSIIYGSLLSFVVATLAWINCLACAVFMIVGINEWCAAVKKAGESSCENAQSWKWETFNPQPLDGSQFYDYFFMVEVSSYAGIFLWFLVAFMSGRQMRKAIYHLQDAQNQYIEQQMSIPRSADSYYNEYPMYINQAQIPPRVLINGDYYDDDEFEARAIDHEKITHL